MADLGIETAGMEDVGIETAGIEDVGIDVVGIENPGIGDVGIENAGIAEVGIADVGMPDDDAEGTVIEGTFIVVEPIPGVVMAGTVIGAIAAGEVPPRL